MPNNDEPPSRRPPINRSGPPVRPPRIPTVHREAASPRPDDERVRDSRESERPPPPPVTNGRLSIAERALGHLRTLTVTNVLILALMAIVGIPSFGMYKFLTDENFRREFLVKGELVPDLRVPCIVLRTSGPGRATRYTVGAVAATVDGVDRIAALRSVAGQLSDTEIAAACREAETLAARLRGPP